MACSGTYPAMISSGINLTNLSVVFSDSSLALTAPVLHCGRLARSSIRRPIGSAPRKLRVKRCKREVRWERRLSEKLLQRDRGEATVGAGVLLSHENSTPAREAHL